MWERLRGRFVVSCQPVPGGPLDRPDFVAAMAEAAVAGGAAGVRIEGLANIRAARARIGAPIIGLVKTDAPARAARITPDAAQARAIAAAGADIVAVDATDRARPDPLADILAAIHDAGALALADCALPPDGQRARALGFDALASTLSGYLDAGPAPVDPDLALVRALRATGGFVIAEGRYDTPARAAEALAAGADCVVAGTALTRLEIMTGRFVAALDAAAAAARPRENAQ